jgi:polygalacturonase
MAPRIKVTVGHSGTTFQGRDDLAIQAAVDYVAAQGGGTVEVRPGLYQLHNSVRLHSGIELIGCGPDTVLRKEPSSTVLITEDTDWYDAQVTVADTSPFRVGGGVLLRGKCPHYKSEQIVIHTVRAIEGQTLWLKSQARGADGAAHTGNFWVGHEATASTLFSLVTANWASDIRVANLRLDGNRTKNAALSGNYGGGMYFQDCERVHVDTVNVVDLESDCLSFQVVHDLTIENCEFVNAVQGIHPGSGSQRPVIRNNIVRQCTRHGLSWCWGVRHGLAENNLIEDCPVGISIGHRDTDNIMRGNTVRRCRDGGLVYRNDPPHQAAHRNLIENNLFEDIGTLEKPGCGIDLDGPVEDNVLRGNRIVCTRPGLMRAGIRIGPQVTRLELDRNLIEGIPQALEDHRLDRV